MKNRLRKLLEEIRHEFASMDGLSASDKEDMSEAFKLEFSQIIKKIDKELGKNEKKM